MICKNIFLCKMKKMYYIPFGQSKEIIVMHSTKILFSQLISFLPKYEFNKCVDRYRGNHKVKNFYCWDQFLCMAFAQITFRRSLRSTVTCLRARPNKLYRMGFRSHISRSTLADANENRDWRIYADYAQILINIAKDLYKNEKFVIDLKETVYALDSTTIDLCLSMFPWAKFRKTKSAIKLHTLLDLRGNIPDFIEITDGKFHDVNILDVLVPQAGSFYLMDRAYNDFGRLFQINLLGAFFIVRAKSNMKFRRLYSHSIDKTTGLKCDQTIILTGENTAKDYPQKLRRVKYYDSEKQKTFTFITNNFFLDALTIALLYKCRWQIELFFKWIKQHLRIKTFFGTSENAVKTQIWIAVCVYILIAISKKRLNSDVSLYTFLEILSTSIFEEVNIFQLVTNADYNTDYVSSSNQLNLFD